MKPPMPLLGIDVGCELERLGDIAAPWQVPAELVRWAIAAGAHRVDVRLGWRHLRVWAEGATLGSDVLAVVAAAVDRTTAAARRHDALRELEAAEQLVWLWALRAGRGLAVGCGGAAGWSCTLQPDGRRDGPTAASLPVPGIEVTVRRPHHPREGRRWLRHACALAPAVVRLGGVRISRARLAPIAGAVERPLRARLGLGGDHLSCRLWLLRHGVLGGLATVPGWPGFVAAVELAGEVVPGASAAALRDAVRPHLGALLEQAALLAAHAAPRLERVPAAVAASVQDVLLSAYRLGVSRAEVASARAFAWHDAGSVRWCSLADLRALAAGELRVAAPRRGRAADGDGALILDQRLWAPLADGLGVRVVRAGAGRLGDWGERVRAWRERPLGRAGAEVPPPLVVPEEAALLRVLGQRGAWDDGTAVDPRLTRGAGAPRRRGARLLLPRHAPLVRAAVRALVRRPELADAVVLALLAPAGGPIAIAENAGPAVPVVAIRTEVGPHAV